MMIMIITLIFYCIVYNIYNILLLLYSHINYMHFNMIYYNN